MPPLRPNRRHLLAGIGTVVLLPVAAKADAPVYATDFGVAADSAADQSLALQQAIDAANASGQALILPPGRVLVQGLIFPGEIVIEGTPGRTELAGTGSGPIGSFTGVSNAVVRNVGFAADASSAQAETPALLIVYNSTGLTFEHCGFTGSPASGLHITGSALTISDCDFSGHADAAIHSVDSQGLLITGNRISACGNAGIRIWRSASGADGSIITHNRISNVATNDGGNGQNGNGINIFKADEVIVSDNHIADCAFSAIRLNTTNNTQVSGNTCLRSGETAIYSEFGFSGSLIASNIIDGAATGISMTNYNEGGRLAVCTGNIVRNIAPSSLVNPDTSPVGIYAEADAAVTGNTVHHVPGPGIVAGYGPYLRNVLIANNVMYDILVGVAVSIAPGAGTAQVANNMIFGPERAIVGMAWADMVEPDLIAKAADYPQLTIANNSIAVAPAA